MRRSPVSEVLRPLCEAPVQAYLTNRVQLADVLEWIISQVGRSDVSMTSFSISEEFIRRLFLLRRSGDVRRFRLLLDHKATQKTLRLWTFIAQTIEETFLADNHSKVLVVSPVDTARHRVAVITSQNLTRGNRSEAAVVTTSPEVVSTLDLAIGDLINFHSVPLNDLLSRNLGAG